MSHKLPSLEQQSLLKVCQRSRNVLQSVVRDILQEASTKSFDALRLCTPMLTPMIDNNFLPSSFEMPAEIFDVLYKFMLAPIPSVSEGVIVIGFDNAAELAARSAACLMHKLGASIWIDCAVVESSNNYKGSDLERYINWFSENRSTILPPFPVHIIQENCTLAMTEDKQYYSPTVQSELLGIFSKPEYQHELEAEDNSKRNRPKAYSQFTIVFNCPKTKTGTVEITCTIYPIAVV